MLVYGELLEKTLAFDNKKPSAAKVKLYPLRVIYKYCHVPTDGGGGGTISRDT